MGQNKELNQEKQCDINGVVKELKVKEATPFKDYLRSEGYELNYRNIWQKDNKEMDMTRLDKYVRKYMNL
jgi:hypothetical protein